MADWEPKRLFPEPECGDALCPVEYAYDGGGGLLVAALLAKSEVG
jgi:hypothetical protein